MERDEQFHWLVQHRIQTSPTDLRDSPTRLRHWAEQRARQDQGCLRRLNATLLTPASPDYPQLLREIPDPPPFLYARGRLDLLRGPLLAIVGSRKCSAYGRRAAREFATDLAAAGLGVCSGLALGVDGEAHRGALAVDGDTVAVLGTGIDRIYPRRHASLGEEIAARGLLLSEFAPGTPPLAQHFPRRNRLISGLSLGALIVEATIRSGSLVTARMAMEQGRDVFALPHSIYHPGGRGCNALLRDGAGLVECAADILGELGWCSLMPAAEAPPALSTTPAPPASDTATSAPATSGISSPATSATSTAPSTPAISSSTPPAPPDVPPHLQPLLEQVGFEPCGVDELVARCGGDTAAVMGALVELELLGALESRDGLYMRR